MYIGTVPSTGPIIPTPPIVPPAANGLLLMYMYSLLPTFC